MQNLDIPREITIKAHTHANSLLSLCNISCDVLAAAGSQTVTSLSLTTAGWEKRTGKTRMKKLRQNKDQLSWQRKQSDFGKTDIVYCQLIHIHYITGLSIGKQKIK